MAKHNGEGYKVGFDGNPRLEYHDSKVSNHSKYVTSQMAEVAVSRKIFAEILLRIERLRCCPV